MFRERWAGSKTVRGLNLILIRVNVQSRIFVKNVGIVLTLRSDHRARIHIGLEHFGLRNSPRKTALHVSLSVAPGAFSLAAPANIHAQRTGIVLVLTQIVVKTTFRAKPLQRYSPKMLSRP